MTPEFLSDNDPDLKIARRIGSYLEGDTSSEEENRDGDSLLEMLSVYKQHTQNSTPVPPALSRALWEQIDRKTQPNAPSKIRIFTFDTVKKSAAWAAAAAITIVTFIGIFFLTLPQSHTLLAETDSAIETITLSDGSEVTLRPNSKLYRLEGSEDAVNYRLSGEGFFRVIHDPDRAFIVEAGNGKVSVLGTRFNLSSWGQITQVFLEEGSIQFTHIQNHESVILKPGESLIIASDTSIPVAFTANAEEFTDWMDTLLVFDNKPAGYVFRELEHHFGIEITAPEDVLTTPISSGGLTLEHEEASLEYLGLVLGGSFRSAGPKAYTFVSNN